MQLFHFSDAKLRAFQISAKTISVKNTIYYIFLDIYQELCGHTIKILDVRRQKAIRMRPQTLDFRSQTLGTIRMIRRQTLGLRLQVPSGHVKQHRAAHWMKRIFMEGACDRFILNVVETECFSILMEGCHAVVGGLAQKKAAEAGLRQASSVQAPRSAVPLNQNSF